MSQPKGKLQLVNQADLLAKAVWVAATSTARSLSFDRVGQTSRGAHDHGSAMVLGRRSAALACAKGESGIGAAAQSGRSI